MKKIFALFAIALLSACSSPSITTERLSLSSAELSNVVVQEQGEPMTRNYNIDVSFNYHIDGYHDEPWLYQCLVGFKSTDPSDGYISASTVDKWSECNLDQADGKMHVKYKAPLSANARFTKEQLEKLEYPIHFSVIIMQKRKGALLRKVDGNEVEYQSIGQSKEYILKKTENIRFAAK